MNVLVDTSVWSLAVRRSGNLLPLHHRNLRKVLEELISESRARLIGPIRQELLSGIRHSEQYERLRKALRAFPDVPISTEDYEQAALMSNICRANGIAESSVDYLICATAARRNWPILTIDRDFDNYAQYLPIKLLKSPIALQ